MKKTFVFIAIAAVALAACTKESPIADKASVKTVLSIGSQPDAQPAPAGAPSKTTLGPEENNQRQIYWADGDQVCANGVASEALENIEPNTVTRADFTFNSSISAPYNAVYPASIWKNASTITLPAHAQNNVLPLGGQSATSSFSLGLLTSGVRVSVKRAASNPDKDEIAMVEVSAADNRRLSGDFSINWETTPPTLTPAASPSGDDLKVRVTGNWNTSAVAHDFFIPLPAGTYSISVKVMDVNGHYMVKSTTSAKEFAQGQVLQLKAFEFIPGATETGIEIGSAADLIAFAQAYNNGDYDNLADGLVATVTADIAFDATSSAAFNATGGIGQKKTYFGDAKDKYFTGIFNGNNHTISGLTATVPLFKATGKYGHIRDLTIASSSSFTFTHNNSAAAPVGSVVGWHKGALENVTVAAPVSLATASVTNETYLGGLVGRAVEGSVIGCTYSGALSVVPGFQSAAQKIEIGGLVGYISNADGSIKTSHFTGTIDNEGKMVASEETSELKANPYLMIGGLVGLNYGTVDGCDVANHATGIAVSLGGNNYTGTIVTHSTNAYHYAIAGVAGRNEGTVKGCTNNANILNVFSAERGTSGNLNGRYLNVGGIVGYNAADGIVQGSCANNGIIIDRAAPKLHYVGGIVGRNYGSVTASQNTASGDITVGSCFFDGPYSARYLYLGGIIGINESTGVLNGVTNAGDLTVEALEDNNTVISGIGGIVGWSKTAIDGSSAAISNSGNIQQTIDTQKVTTENRDETSNAYGYYLGGIVGYTSKGINTVSNSGNIEYICNFGGDSTVEASGGARYIFLGGIAGQIYAATLADVQYCTNSGDLTFNPTATAPGGGTAATQARYDHCYLGGIIGNGNLVRIKGDSTTKTVNSGNVLGGDNSGNVNTAETFWVGGIAGRVYGKGSLITYCDITGETTIYNCHWCNRGYSSYAPMCGGIAGEMYASGGSISYCELASTVTVMGARGDTGGIVGYARYATVSNCTVNREFNGQSSYCTGGIVAWLRNGTVSNCTFNGGRVRSSQLQVGGGIVGRLDQSTIDACSSYATDVSKNGTAIKAGALAGESVATSTIKDSHYKSALAICGDSNYTDGGGNAADL